MFIGVNQHLPMIYLLFLSIIFSISINLAYARLVPINCKFYEFTYSLSQWFGMQYPAKSTLLYFTGVSLEF